MESIAQICLLGVTNSMQIRQKIYSMQKKNPSRNPLSRNLAISKKILLKQFQEKKDHYNTTKRFLPLFHGLWSIQTSVEQRRTSAKWGYSLLNSCIIFSNFQFSQNVTTDYLLIYVFCTNHNCEISFVLLCRTCRTNSDLQLLHTVVLSCGSERKKLHGIWPSPSLDTIFSESEFIKIKIF